MAAGEVHIDVSRWEQILLDIAEPILNSRDMRQALGQSASDAQFMRELVRAHTADLICAQDNPELDFVERIKIPKFARQWRRLLVLSLAGCALIFPLSRAWSLYFLLLCWTAFYLAIMGNLILFGGRQLEPVEETRRVLEHLVIGPFLREQINQLLAGSEGAGAMRVTSAPGLAELSERQQVIFTDTLHDLVRLSRAMSSGSIGISGPRGVGKTTLLRYFCDPSLGAVPDVGRQPLVNVKDFRFMISAPVEYDTRDFILHLFEKFCLTVLQVPSDGASRDLSSVAGKQRFAKVGLVVLGGLLAAMGAALGIYTLLAPKRLPRFTKLDDYLAVAAAALIIGIFLLSWQLT